MKNNLKRLFTLILGFIIGSLFVSILISIGYYHVYATSAKSFTVTFLGLSLYEIVQSGKAYIGTAVGPNIGIISSFFALLALLVKEAWGRLAKKRQKES